MTDTITAATAADQRLAEFAERVRKVAAGEPDADLDDHLAEDLDHRVAGGSGDPWRYDMRAERLECLLDIGHRLVDELRGDHYASLPQAVRDADAAADAAARAKREARWAAMAG